MTTANFPLPVPNLDNQEFWDQCPAAPAGAAALPRLPFLPPSAKPQLPGVRFVQPGVGGVAGEGHGVHLRHNPPAGEPGLPGASPLGRGGS